MVVEKPKARSKAAKKKAVMEETEVDEEGEVISEDLAGMRSVKRLSVYLPYKSSSKLMKLSECESISHN